MAPVIAVSGFMGSGKTAVGRTVAERLGLRFFDLDAEVEAAAGATVEDLFARDGELAFREIEHATLRAVLEREREADERAVLALGGGTVTWPASARLLADSATVVLLTAPVDDQWGRVAGGSRPLARSAADFRALAEARRETYRATADAVVDSTGLGVEETAEAVIQALAGLGGPRGGDPEGTTLGWRFDLATPSRPSVVVGGPGSLAVLEERAGMVAEAGLRVYVVSDANVMRLHGTRLMERLGAAGPAGGTFIVEPGESSKDAVTAARCWEWLASVGARRDDIVLAFGGGVVGDLAGFVAATYLRGVRLWQVPTTLLAQVDSSVGGKVAINLAAGKNLVGSFYQPELVVADQDLLDTLTPAELGSGLGEVVKYALLEGEDFLRELEMRADEVAEGGAGVLGGVVARCVGMKAEVVAEDETDRGRRAVLNLGHTVGHALEAAAGYGVLSHGAAVGLGLLAALAVSEAVTGLPRTVRTRTEALLTRFGLPVRMPPLDEDSMLSAMERDKKVSAAGLGFVCLQDVGRPVWGVAVDADLIRASLKAIRP